MALAALRRQGQGQSSGPNYGGGGPRPQVAPAPARNNRNIPQAPQEPPKRPKPDPWGSLAQQLLKQKATQTQNEQANLRLDKEIASREDQRTWTSMENMASRSAESATRREEVTHAERREDEQRRISDQRNSVTDNFATLESLQEQAIFYQGKGATNDYNTQMFALYNGDKEFDSFEVQAQAIDKFGENAKFALTRYRKERGLFTAQNLQDLDAYDLESATKLGPKMRQAFLESQDVEYEQDLTRYMQDTEAGLSINEMEGESFAEMPQIGIIAARQKANMTAAFELETTRIGKEAFDVTHKKLVDNGRTLMMLAEGKRKQITGAIVKRVLGITPEEMSEINMDNPSDNAALQGAKRAFGNILGFAMSDSLVVDAWVNYGPEGLEQRKQTSGKVMRVWLGQLMDQTNPKFTPALMDLLNDPINNHSSPALEMAFAQILDVSENYLGITASSLLKGALKDGSLEGPTGKKPSPQEMATRAILVDVRRQMGSVAGLLFTRNSIDASIARSEMNSAEVLQNFGSGHASLPRMKEYNKLVGEAWSFDERQENEIGQGLPGLLEKIKRLKAGMDPNTPPPVPPESDLIYQKGAKAKSAPPSQAEKYDYAQPDFGPDVGAMSGSERSFTQAEKSGAEGEGFDQLGRNVLGGVQAGVEGVAGGAISLRDYISKGLSNAQNQGLMGSSRSVSVNLVPFPEDIALQQSYMPFTGEQSEWDMAYQESVYKQKQVNKSKGAKKKHKKKPKKSKKKEDES